MLGNWWFRKERPIQGAIGFGGGATGNTFFSASVPFIASGGQQDGIQPGNGYKYHTFYNTGPGTFTVTQGTRECMVMVLGGGGSGGNGDGGENSGAGAGGICFHKAFELAPGTYAVTVGDGAHGVPAPYAQSGKRGENSTFAGPGGSFTMTGEAGNEGYGPDASNFTPTFPSNSGCGAGGIWNKPTYTNGIPASQPTAPQPGVPPGYQNLGWPGGDVRSTVDIGPTGPGGPFAWQTPQGGGGGGGCGMMGGALTTRKSQSPANPDNFDDYQANIGGNGWAAPPVFSYPHVFGPQAPTVTPYCPTNNMYGGGGVGQLAPPNAGTGMYPLQIFNGWYRQTPAGRDVGPPMPGYIAGYSAGYGGGGVCLPSSYPGTWHAPHFSFPPAKIPLSTRSGKDKLGGGGAGGSRAWPQPFSPSGHGDGGSGCVVIAYVDVENSGSAWNATTTAVPVSIWGGGGAGGQAKPQSTPVHPTGSIGGGGGFYTGTLNLIPGSYTFCVGSAGAPHPSPETPTDGAGFGGAPVRDGNGGGGGGYTGIFRADFTPTGDPKSFHGMMNVPGPSHPDVPSYPEPKFPRSPTRSGTSGHDKRFAYNAAPYNDLNLLQQHAIFLVGGGGSASEASCTGSAGGGGGGYQNGLPGAAPPSFPFPGYALGGGGTSTAGGENGMGDSTPGGRRGIWMMGGWVGPGADGAGSGGGGYFGGGQGGAQTGSDNTEMSGGGSGHIEPDWVSGASGEAGKPGIEPGAMGYSGGTTDPLYPGTAGRAGTGYPNANVGAGAVVFGPHSGTLAVTPPGGSPSSVPTSGQAFNTAGVYKLVVS